MVSAEMRAEARARLSRAEEFLTFASFAEGDENYSNSIVSLSVQSAIASSDAVLIVNEVRRAARANHDDAPTALRSIGHDALANALTRILRLKPKAQYSAGETCTPAEAAAALSGASKMLNLANAECNRRMKK